MQESYLQTGFIRMCWQKLFWLILLNFLFIVCSIPLITIPAAITALTCACQRAVLDESGLVRTFFRSFRVNLVQAIPVGLLFVAGPAALIYGCAFYYQASKGEAPGIALSIFCMVFIYILFCMGTFAFQMLARVQLKVSAILRNAFVLTFQQWKVILGWLLLSFALLIAIWLFFPYSFPWILLLGVALPCFTGTRGALPIIDRLIVKE